MQIAADQIVAAAVVNKPPTATATFSTANPTTGVVTGKLTGSDPEGTKVTIALTTKPTAGTLVYNATTATFTYTPTTAQRILAGATAQADTIAMTITVSDGVNKVPGADRHPHRSDSDRRAHRRARAAGAGAVAATNTRAYVTNRAQARSR